MTKDEALKLALNALENHEGNYKLGNAGCDRQEKAITAIKEALAQPEQEPVAMRMPKAGDKVICLEDESLASVISLTAGGSPYIVFSDGSRGTYLLREFAELFGYATPFAAQPEQEPVGEVTKSGNGDYPVISWKYGYVAKIGDKFYTAPPQRTWVGPTDEQIEAALKAACMHSTLESRKDMRRAIKAAHGIKEKNT
jgi:hypothetical protein